MRLAEIRCEPQRLGDRQQGQFRGFVRSRISSAKVPPKIHQDPGALSMCKRKCRVEGQGLIHRRQGCAQQGKCLRSAGRLRASKISHAVKKELISGRHGCRWSAGAGNFTGQQGHLQSFGNVMCQRGLHAEDVISRPVIRL